MNKHIFILNGVARCVDSDTEFFNGYRWKKISDYCYNDKVLQYNKDGTATLVTPFEYYKNNTETLFLLNDKNINMCLSSNHNVYYISSENKLCRKTWVEIIEYIDKTQNGFFGKLITTFNYSGNGINLSNNEIRLMTSIFLNNPILNGSKIKINLKNKNSIDRLHGILNLCNIEYFTRVSEYKKDYITFYFEPPILEKHFNSYWYNATKEQLKVIYEEIEFWNNNKEYIYLTSSKKEADFIQFVLSVFGYRSIIDIYDKNKYIVLKYNDVFPIIDNNNIKSVLPYKTKDGYSYCFSVPSGMLVLRRDNKIFITGNSGKDSFKSCLNRITPTYSISTVDKIKEVCRILGWDGEKTEESRLALSDFKDLATKHFDHSYNYVKKELEYFLKEDTPFRIFTVDTREPDEIERFKKEFGFKTILIVRDDIKDIPNNHADKNVYKYKYDYIIHNDGTLEDLYDKAELFIKSLD